VRLQDYDGVTKGHMGWEGVKQKSRDILTYFKKFISKRFKKLWFLINKKMSQ